MTRKLPALLLPLLLLVFVARVNAVEITTDSVQATASPTQAAVSTVKPTATDNATKLREQLKLLQDQKKTAVTQVKDEARTLIQTQKEEFKTRLQTIKDQKKKTTVERIDTKIAEVNKNQTLKFTENLTRLQAFLEKISDSATPTATLTDIAAAQAAVDVAKTAVEAQAAKTYVITIADDSTLKLNVGTVVSQFRLDLVATYKLVVDAKQAVQKLNTDKNLIKKEVIKQVPDGNLSTDSAKL